MGCIRLDILEQEYNNREHKMFMLKNNLTKNKSVLNLRRAYFYGMNGQEKDDEISGSGNSYTAEFWQYDSRLGRRFNQDPKPNPSISNYACFANNPILFSDPKGDTLSFNFFSKLIDIYNFVAYTLIKKQKSDGIYVVFAHGSKTAIFNQSGIG